MYPYTINIMTSLIARGLNSLHKFASFSKGKDDVTGEPLTQRDDDKVGWQLLIITMTMTMMMIVMIVMIMTTTMLMMFIQIMSSDRPNCR